MKKFKKILIILNLSRGLILCLFIIETSWNTLVLAEDVVWPLGPMMTDIIFTPYLTMQFSDIQGLARFRTQADDLDHHAVGQAFVTLLKAQRRRVFMFHLCNTP